MTTEALFKFILDLLNTSTASVIIGGLITLFGVWLSAHFTKREAQRAEKESVKTFLQSIEVEFITLWNIYHEVAGKKIESVQEGHFFDGYFGAEQDYFIIYNKNSHFLGKINDEELRKQIVITYTKAKSIIDSYTLNNQTLNQYLHMYLLFQQTEIKEYERNYKEYKNVLIKYAARLKEAHFDLKEEQKKLQIQIQAYLKNIE